MRIPMRAIRKIVIVPAIAALALVGLGAPLAHAAGPATMAQMVDLSSGTAVDLGTSYVITGNEWIVLQAEDTADPTKNNSSCDPNDTGTNAVIKILVNGSTTPALTLVRDGSPKPAGPAWVFDTGANGYWAVDLYGSAKGNGGVVSDPGVTTIQARCQYTTPTGESVDTNLGTFTLTLPGVTSDSDIFTLGCTNTVTAIGLTPAKTALAYLVGGPSHVRTLLGTATVLADGTVTIAGAVPSNLPTTSSSWSYTILVTDDALPGVGVEAWGTALVLPNVAGCPVPPTTPGDVVAAESTVTPDTAVGLLTLGTARQSSGVDSYNIGISLNDKDGNIVTDQAASTLSVANLPVGATAKFTKNTDGTFNLFITSTVPGWFPVQVMYTPAGGSAVAIGDPINVAFIGAAVTTDEVPANGTETVVGYGFQPYEWVVGIVHSNPMQTARVQADVNGKVTISFSVAQLAKGDHTVALQGDKSGITQVVPFTVCQIVSTGGSVVTSSAATTGIVVMLMMVAGLGVAAVRMRRSTL